MSQTRILIAEDEPIGRMDLREMLQNLGYQVVDLAGLFSGRARSLSLVDDGLQGTSVCKVTSHC